MLPSTLRCFAYLFSFSPTRSHLPLNSMYSVFSCICTIRLRTKNTEDEFLERIQDAFDSLYEGTCMKDDQKDFTGQRYLIARELRLLLTTLGGDPIYLIFILFLCFFYLLFVMILSYFHRVFFIQ